MKQHYYRRIFGLFLVICLLLSGCDNQTIDSDTATYFKIDSDRAYFTTIPVSPKINSEYSNQFAVIPASEHVTSDAAMKLCINNTENVVVDSVNPFDKIYPASITKIMTALLVIENGDLSDIYTVTEPIELGDPMAVSLDLSIGDTISVEELLYGLLLESANDYAVALGRYVAGSDEAFIVMMNERAQQLGATHTHFTNPNGLHNEEHYTTGYDLYLIFRELIKHDDFQQIAGQAAHTLHYIDGDGNPIEKSLSNSNLFISEAYSVPDGITVLCGKTGTTNEAGYCLIIESKDVHDNDYITVVCGAGSRERLYSLISNELELILQE